MPGRILLAKVGLDGHNRGIHVLANALRDAGFEVVYLGLRRKPREVGLCAVDEGVDCVGVSIHSGAHRTVLPAIRQELDKAGGDDIPLIAGGIIPDDDVDWLRERGTLTCYGPGSTLKEIVQAIQDICAASRPADSSGLGPLSSSAANPTSGRAQ